MDRRHLTEAIGEPRTFKRLLDAVAAFEGQGERGSGPDQATLNDSKIHNYQFSFYFVQTINGTTAGTAHAVMKYTNPGHNYSGLRSTPTVGMTVQWADTSNASSSINACANFEVDPNTVFEHGWSTSGTTGTTTPTID